MTLTARALVLSLALAAAACGQRPQTEPAAPRPASPTVVDRLLGIVIDRGIEAVQDAIGKLLDAVRARMAAAGTLRAAAPAAEPQAVRLELVRRWKTPPPRWDRVRLAADPDGYLLVARPERGAAVLEDASGRVLERSAVAVQGKADFFPVKVAGGHLLVRSAGALYYAGAEVARAPWETYAGLEGVLLAWYPCQERGCPAQVLVRGVSGFWQAFPGPQEVFGADLLGDLALAPGATGAVAIATREAPASSGWTLRLVDQVALRAGVLQELAPRQVWRPARGVSLEDPRLVPGAAGPMLIGGAAERTGSTWSSTGRIYLAEPGRPLRVILTAAPEGNDEPGAVVHRGTLYVAAQRGPGQSGLWRYEDRRGLQILAVADGERPALASAGGRLWISTSVGLYALAE